MMKNNQRISAILNDLGIIYSNSQNEQIKTKTDGPSPMDMLLMSVAGCSGLTLKSLLSRDGYTPKKLQLHIEGIKNDKRPRNFKEIVIIYDVECEELTDKSLEKYLNITERTCPVVQSLNAQTRVMYTLN